MSSAQRPRFPASLYTEGDEPDARFTLANERTFLAWIGASLALVSVGVALESFALGLHPHLRLGASLLLILAGMACAIQAWFGWVRVERALRHNRPLPASPLTLPLSVTVSVVGVLLLLAVILG